MTDDVSPYTSLITPEHNQRPKYMAMIAMTAQPFADNIALLATFPALFDLDYAVGAQLDVVGLWVGVTRNIGVAVPNTFFTFDTSGLGFDEGLLPALDEGGATDIVVLPDPQFRTLIRARIASNHWDGTIPGAYAIWGILFGGTGYTIQIQDNGDMTMDLTLVGPNPDPLTLALFEGGYLDLRPSGVRIAAYNVIVT